ncbi:MAG TPA: hypothetical protein PK156_44810 [Polyangium sp.]|nr:hypothetical protein [Polyangium sp.]
MRSRPDLRVYVEPESPAPGDRLHVRVCLDSHNVTPFHSVDVYFTGREKRYKNTSSNGKTSQTHYHERSVVNLGARFEGGVLEKGPWERSVTIDLPADLPPTYKSRLSTIAYELSVRVDIPWWPDRTGVYTIPVRLQKAPRQKVRPGLYGTQRGETRDGEPVIELSLADEKLFIGGTLEGAIAISDLGKRKLRRVEIALISVEQPVVESTNHSEETDKRTWKVFDGTPENGKSIPFLLQIPADVPPTFRSPFIQVTQYLEVTAVVAFGLDVSLRIPTFVCRGKPAKDEPTEKKALPIVGQERQLTVWQAAVGQSRLPTDVNLRLDTGSPAVCLDIQGMSVQIREEVRRDVGPCLVASLTYPSLGMQLRLAERRWIDFGGKWAEIDHKLRQRFTISAREEAQGSVLFNLNLSKALRWFHEVGLNDESTVAMRKGGVYQVAGLVRFIAGAYELAQQLRMATKDLPPPGAFSEAFAAYQQFAQHKGISLRRGDCALPQWTLRGVPLTLEHRWNGAAPIETCLWTSKPADDNVLNAEWKQAFEALGQVRAVEDDERFGLALPVVHDPVAINELCEHFVATVLKLSGVKMGAYR